MIAQVIPLKKIPRQLEYFDYLIPPSLSGQVKTGCLVKIPWRNQVIFGLVKQTVKKPARKDVKLKEIISLTYPKTLATKGQVSLIEGLAKSFLLAPSLWWKMILPQVPKKKAKFKPWLNENRFAKNKLEAASVSRSKNKLQLVIPESFTAMVSLAVKLAKSRGTNLLLCPEIKQIETILSYLPKNFIKKIAVFHKRQSKSEYWHNYLKVINNQASLIIGTRLAVLSPFTKLNKIVVFKSEDYSFKQTDQNPRFWIHDVVFALQKIYDAKLYFLSLAPRISNYAYVKNQRGQIISRQKPLKTRVVDLGKEFQINNYTYISWQLEQSINQAISKKKKVFLLVNRKGLARRLVCKDCGFTAKCEVCQRLMQVKENKRLYCGICQQVKPVPAKCPACQGVNLSNQGVTNQYIYNQIKEIWPNVNVQYIDVNNKKISKSTKIVVGTQFALSQMDWSNFSLVALVTADQEINQTDYHASEYGWQLFSYLARMVKNLEVVFQTWQPDLYIYEYFRQGKYERFWQSEMNLRKKYTYPPYSKFLKCLISDKNEQVAKSKALDLYKKLNNNLPPTVKVNTPLPAAGIKLNNKFVWFVLIKYSQENLYDQLHNLPADVILDFNPYSVF